MEAFSYSKSLPFIEWPVTLNDDLMFYMQLNLTNHILLGQAPGPKSMPCVMCSPIVTQAFFLLTVLFFVIKKKDLISLLWHELDKYRIDRSKNSMGCLDLGNWNLPLTILLFNL